MKCYYHEEKSAVGVCPACFRGICKDCIAVQENLISCNNDICKKRVIDMLELSKTNINLIKSNSNPINVVKNSRIFNVLMGILFIIMGITLFPANHTSGILLAFMGLTLFIYGFYFLIKGRKTK